MRIILCVLTIIVHVSTISCWDQRAKSSQDNTTANDDHYFIAVNDGFFLVPKPDIENSNSLTLRIGDIIIDQKEKITINDEIWRKYKVVETADFYRKYSDPKQIRAKVSNEGYGPDGLANYHLKNIDFETRMLFPASRQRFKKGIPVKSEFIVNTKSLTVLDLNKSEKFLYIGDRLFFFGTYSYEANGIYGFFKLQRLKKINNRNNSLSDVDHLFINLQTVSSGLKVLDSKNYTGEVKLATGNEFRFIHDFGLVYKILPDQSEDNINQLTQEYPIVFEDTFEILEGSFTHNGSLYYKLKLKKRINRVPKSFKGFELVDNDIIYIDEFSALSYFKYVQ